MLNTIVWIVAALCLNVCYGDRELKSSIVIFRHGDRTPVDLYPNDPYKDPSNWPVGFGQLTARGKMMHYRLGQYLRRRYATLLDEKYSEKDVYVRSSDTDRTLMSALSNLAGLYPPHGDLVWNCGLPWQPIPVHTRPISADNLLSSHAHCPRLSSYVDAVPRLPEVKSVLDAHRWVFDYLSEHAGTAVKTIWDVEYLYDTLYIEELYNKTLPAWTRKVYPDHMEALRNLSFRLTTWTHKMRRLRSGPLVQNVIDHFRGFISGHRTYKLLMYSTHDTTVASFLNTLEVFNALPPPYAACIMVELYLNDDVYELKFSYHNDSLHDPYELKLPMCGDNAYCPIDVFDNVTVSLRPIDWEAECELRHDPTIQAVTIFSLCVTSLLVIILTVAAVTSLIRMRRASSTYQYVSVPRT